MKILIWIILIIALIILLALFLRWSNKALVLTRYNYYNQKIGDGLDGLVITQVSDLQSEYFGRGQKNIMDMVVRTCPDIIVYTGDLLDRNHTDYEAALTLMKGLKKIAPVFYINGNHEVALPDMDTGRLYDKLREMGVHVMFDDGEVFTTKDGAALNIVGISEETVYKGKPIYEQNSRQVSRVFDESFINDVKAKTLSKLDSAPLTVMLVHEPQYINTYDDEKVDLIFAGHAHGGQIRLPFTEGLFSPGQGFMPKYTSGIHHGSNSTMIISRGLGNSTFPFRIFNRPEIVTVVLGKEQVN